MMFSHLLDWSSIPPHLQFNRFVLGGYRPLQSVGECVQSLFYLHNELFNILSHGLPILFFAKYATDDQTWSQISYSWLAYLNYAACLSPHLGSVAYHLFMNHRSGAWAYFRLLKLDMCGVWAVQTFGALTTIYATFYCNKLLQASMMTIYILVSSWTLYEAVHATSVYKRMCSFAVQVAIRLLTLLVRLSPLGYGNPYSTKHTFLMDAIAISGGVINLLRVPERFWPGKFDYFLNSHNIMHIMTTIGVFHMHWGAVGDIIWASQYQCNV
ncbi:progestin and adipoQ receptor family member 4-like [Branchiostoma floridae x Branchiostoma japonicum]